MNEHLLHLLWRPRTIYTTRTDLPNISINYCLRAINTRSGLEKEKKQTTRVNDVQTEIDDRDREIL